MTAEPRLSPELTVTVGTGWTYIGDGEALRLRAITGGCAVIEIARADLAFPAEPAGPGRHPAAADTRRSS